MNILLIVADQLAVQALSCYGHAHRTPNIDRLASRGVRFDRCYTPSPLCMPARAALWTGRWPHETGVMSNERNADTPPIPPSMPTLGRLFEQAGWTTRHFGKQHDSGALRGFVIEPTKAVEVPAVDPWPLNNDTFCDRYTTQRTVEFLRQWTGGRFLAVADLINPHNICGWVGRHQGPHTDDPLPPGVELPPLPDNFDDAPEEFARRPLPVQYLCCTHVRLAQTQGWTPDNYRHYLAAYYHYVDRLDGEIGRILDAVEARADADQTLILFFADHGDAMTAHRMVTKQATFQDEIARVPLIAAGPGVEPGVSRRTPLVSLLDLLPTLCEVAQIAPPRGLWGRSLLPWLREDHRGSPHDHVASEWHTEQGFTVEPGRMIRTDRYKYTRYLEGDGEELYDLLNDPGERHTLIDDADHQATLHQHRALLAQHVRAVDDPFFELQPQVDPRWRSHRPGYHHHTGPAAPMAEKHPASSR